VFDERAVGRRRLAPEQLAASERLVSRAFAEDPESLAAWERENAAWRTAEREAWERGRAALLAAAEAENARLDDEETAAWEARRRPARWGETLRGAACVALVALVILACAWALGAVLASWWRAGR
jgi:hypothetical protein